MQAAAGSAVDGRLFVGKLDPQRQIDIVTPNGLRESGDSETVSMWMKKTKAGETLWEPTLQTLTGFTGHKLLREHELLGFF